MNELLSRPNTGWWLQERAHHSWRNSHTNNRKSGSIWQLHNTSKLERLITGWTDTCVKKYNRLVNAETLRFFHNERQTNALNFHKCIFFSYFSMGWKQSQVTNRKLSTSGMNQVLMFNYSRGHFVHSCTKKTHINESDYQRLSRLKLYFWFLCLFCRATKTDPCLLYLTIHISEESEPSLFWS